MQHCQHKPVKLSNDSGILNRWSNNSNWSAQKYTRNSQYVTWKAPSRSIKRYTYNFITVVSVYMPVLKFDEQTVPVGLNLEAITPCTGLGLRRIMQVPWQRYCTVCFLFFLFFFSWSPLLFRLALATAAICGRRWKKDTTGHKGANKPQRRENR